MIELKIEKALTVDNATIFVISPKEIALGSAYANNVDTLHLDLPTEWNGCVVKVVIRNRGGFTAERLVDESGNVNLTSDMITSKEGQLFADATSELVHYYSDSLKWNAAYVPTILLPTSAPGDDIYEEIVRVTREAEYAAKDAQDLANDTQNTAHQRANEAAESAAKAKVSEENAAESASKAKTSETAARASEIAAKTSEIAAKTSENKAKASEVAAKASEVAAKASENAAKDSEIAAATSAASASKDATQVSADKENVTESRIVVETKASAASESAGNAKASETAAAQSATNAKASEDAAKTSEVAASASENEAAVSAASAAQSADLAGESASAAAQSENSALGSKNAAENSESTAAQKATEAAQALSDLLAMLGTDIASLVGGKIPMSQIPATATQEIYDITTEAQLTTLVAQRGDLAELIEEINGERTVTKTWQLLGDDSAVRANWVVWGTSYAVQAGNATTATSATTAAQINGHRMVEMSSADFDTAVKGADTYYLVFGGDVT